MGEERFTGGCLCGGVRFEVAGPLQAAAYCHCRRCQRRTGAAASAQVGVAAGSVRIVTGEDLLRAYEPDDGFGKVFCSACGSALWSCRPGQSEPAAIRLGAFDDDPGVRPSYHQFVDYAAPWELVPDDGLPRYPERRPPAA